MSEYHVKPLIIFDSLAAFNLADENSVKEIRAFMEPARVLVNQLGASVLIVHHTGKSDRSQEYRGSSAIKDSVDVAFRLRKKGSSNMLGRLNVKPFKTRFIVAEEREFWYKNGLFTCHGELPAEHPLFAVLRERPLINAKDFEKAASSLGFSRAKARFFLEENWHLIGQIDGGPAVTRASSKAGSGSKAGPASPPQNKSVADDSTRHNREGIMTPISLILCSISGECGGRFTKPERRPIIVLITTFIEARFCHRPEM